MRAQSTLLIASIVICLSSEAGLGQSSSGAAAQRAKDLLGVTLITVTPQISNAIGLPGLVEGLVVSSFDGQTRPGLPIFSRGDLIVRVDGRPISKASDLEESLLLAFKARKKSVDLDYIPHGASAPKRIIVPLNIVYEQNETIADGNRELTSPSGSLGKTSLKCIAGENDYNNSGCASFYVICWGVNYLAPDGTGRYFNPVTTSPMDFYEQLSKEEDKSVLLKYIISKWSLNKPADTWNCKGYNGYAAFNRAKLELANAGYQGSVWHSLPVVPESVLPKVGVRNP